MKDGRLVGLDYQMGNRDVELAVVGATVVRRCRFQAMPGSPELPIAEFESEAEAQDYLDELGMRLIVEHLRR